MYEDTMPLEHAKELAQAEKEERYWGNKVHFSEDALKSNQGLPVGTVVREPRMVICPTQQRRKPGTLCPRPRFLSLALILTLLLPPTTSPEPEPEMAACPTVQIIPLPEALPGPEAPPPEVRVIEDCTVTWYTADDHDAVQRGLQNLTVYWLGPEAEGG